MKNVFTMSCLVTLIFLGFVWTPLLTLIILGFFQKVLICQETCPFFPKPLRGRIWPRKPLGELSSAFSDSARDFLHNGGVESATRLFGEEGFFKFLIGA